MAADRSFHHEFGLCVVFCLYCISACLWAVVCSPLLLSVVSFLGCLPVGWDWMAGGALCGALGSREGEVQSRVRCVDRLKR